MFNFKNLKFKKFEKCQFKNQQQPLSEVFVSPVGVNIAFGFFSSDASFGLLINEK